MSGHSGRFAAYILLGVFGLSPGIAFGQQQPGAISTVHGPPHSRPADPDSEIIVAGHPPVDFAILAATHSLAGDELVARTRGQIGEVLAGLPGLSATSFAPGASRPVLRGFSGDRVAVLIDGIGSIDASAVSVDHAVVFDSLAVDHVDVFHGPAVLLFGGNAIGGAINALDKRIPRQVPDQITATLLGGYGSAGNERSAGAALELPLADRLAFRIDGNWQRSDDLRTGGFVNSRALRADLRQQGARLRARGEAAGADELEALSALSGRVPNSASRTFAFGAGLAFIDAGGDLGVSAQRYETRYGVPMRPGSASDHGDGPHSEGDERVSIDLVQTRVDLRGSVKIGGPFESLQFRGAYGDYDHVELEGAEIGTRFSGEGIEFRADLIQSERKGWRGRSGIHYAGRTLDIDGDEAFTPDYGLERFGLFTLQSLAIGGGITFEGAARFERASVSADQIRFSRRFDLWSAAAGVSWQNASGLTVGINYIHGARAPSPEELLSDGVHVATQSFEIGDPSFASEKSDGAEAYVRFSADTLSFSLTGFLTDFDSFIAAIPEAEVRDSFPVYRYNQVRARYYGFEASAEFEALHWDDGGLQITVGADFTRAQLVDIGPAPLIPPLRLVGEAEVRQGNLRFSAAIEWNDRQDRVARFDRPVHGFTLVDLGADWHPFGESGPLTVMLSADNIFNVVARRAASVTRDFVPLPGRDLRVTAKFEF